MNEFEKETNDMLRRAARADSEAQWLRALAGFRETYADGNFYYRAPIGACAEDGPEKWFLFMLPRQMTEAEAESCRRWVNGMIDLIPTIESLGDDEETEAA